MKLRWKFGVAAGVILMLFALYPQARMLYMRRQSWQGNYALTDVDEPAYAAYLESLIQGAPRKNDPYIKQADSPETPQAESLFSIQFASPYAIALPARLFGIHANTAIVIAGALAAFLAGLSLFWFIGSITGDSMYALVGTLAVICFGALAGGEGAILGILNLRISGPFFPGFRRYAPAIALPLFFAFFTLIRIYVSTSEMRQRLLAGIFALLCFGFMVYSYFYVWTTAAAWLACILLVWLVLRPAQWAAKVQRCAIFIASAALWLIPYVLLLSNRAQTTDSVQLLDLTHSPDFARFPEYVGFGVLLIIAVGVVKKIVDLRDEKTLFAISFALVPFVVHNHQIITGRSLQPVHYDLFTVNYLAILALVLALKPFLDRAFSARENYRSRFVAAIALFAIGWGLIECFFTARVLDGINVDRDRGYSVAKRLRQLGVESQQHGVIMSHNLWVADDLPATVPQPILWSVHQIAFGNVPAEKSRERYYQLLYFKNIDEKSLTEALTRGDFYPITALFGWNRFTTRLSWSYSPLTAVEIAAEGRRYAEYAQSFNPKNSPETIISYLIIPAGKRTDLSNIDKWYERDEGENYDDFTLYRLHLRFRQ